MTVRLYALCYFVFYCMQLYGMEECIILNIKTPYGDQLLTVYPKCTIAHIKNLLKEHIPLLPKTPLFHILAVSPERFTLYKTVFHTLDPQATVEAIREKYTLSLLYLSLSYAPPAQ